MRAGAGRAAVSNLIAGLSVALVLIPQSWRIPRWLPPYGGLYAAALPPLAAPLTPSPFFQTGVDYGLWDEVYSLVPAEPVVLQVAA